MTSANTSSALMIIALGSSSGSSFPEQSPAESGCRVLGKHGRDVRVAAGDADIGMAGIREAKEETSLQVEAGREIGRRLHPATGRTMIYMAARPTHGTDIFVGDRDELAEVRWATLAQADQLMQPHGMFGLVREYLAKMLY